MKEQLLEAWRLHHQVNLLLLQNLSQEALDATLSTKGGRTVGAVLQHLVTVRRQWLQPENKSPLPVQISIEGLMTSHEDSASEVAALIEKAAETGRVKGFKKGLLPFIAYLIAHEAHHRGAILLTLKQCGMPLPEAVRWKLWDWNKL